VELARSNPDSGSRAEAKVRLQNKLLSLAAGGLVLVGLTGQASATPLSALLVAGATLTSGDGNLTFSNFSAVVTGSLLDTSGNNYDVAALPTGFELTGPFLVADGHAGDMVLNYTVTAIQNGITDVHLFQNGTFTGAGITGNAAAVSETVFHSGTPIANLNTIGTSGGAVVLGLTDEATLPGGPFNTLDVKKDISVATIAGGLGSGAHISIIDQTFTTVPEPGTLLLGSAGLIGLVGFGRKRVRQ
jgi:PEP-CTERM motif